MQTAHFVTPTDDGRVRCEACLWRCELHPEQTGRCHMRVARNGTLELLNYGLISGANVGSIEEHRLWHFFPDTLVLGIGSWGYAFPADQERGPYTTIPADPAKHRSLPAEKAAAFALKQLCRGVVWAYGDPAVSAEYTLEILRASRAASRYTALVTTGYMTSETLEQFGPYLDGLALDMRGFGDSAYQRLAGAPHWEVILESVAQIKHRWQVHIEVTTRMHHGVNDDPQELRALTAWIRRALGEQTPWHILPGDAGVETAAAVFRARRIGLDAGLHYIYGIEPEQHTHCPRCSNTLITRSKGVSRVVGISDGQCNRCGFQPYLRTSIFKPRRPQE